jgi:hypothetical protein
MTLIEEIYSSFRNKTRPNIRWKMVGDMYKRMDYIQEKFAGVQTITEFGPFQGCSTAAWLMLRPKKFTTVDQGTTLDIDLFNKAATEVGVEFKFILGNDLEIEIEHCELLFIDTVHSQEHTYNELKTHANKVSKYLVFHDVNPERFGTLAGIEQWRLENSEWKTDYIDYEDCGFMVLKNDRCK